MLYVDEHQNVYPPSADYTLPTGDPDRVWTAKVLPYVQNTAVFTCPNEGITAFPSNWSERGLGSIGYTTATAYDPADVEGFSTLAHASTIQNPAQTPLFADTASGPTAAKYRGFTFDPYNGKPNSLAPQLGTPLLADRDLVKEL
jgi:hypothetical protein